MAKTAMEKRLSTTGNLQAALDYVRRGWHIFPIFYVKKSGACSCNNPRCKRIGKHPATANGVQDASSDEAKIRQWWTENPYANIGLATGHDGLIVMDVDEGTKKNGTAKVGPASLEMMRAGAELPETLIVKTGSGGKHYYFLTEKEFKNSASKVAPDIDFRTYGGYVILPPSNHEMGGKYEWINNSKIAPLPTWLAEKLAGRRKIDFSVDAPDAEAAKHVERKEKLTKKQLLKLLEFIPADDRETWWQVGAAIKKEFGDTEEAFKLFDNWSAGAPDKYDSKDTWRQWESFADKGLTGGTIYHYARENGFRGFDKEAAESSASENAKSGWVFCVATQEFISPDRAQRLSKSQFSDKFAPQASKRGTFADLCLSLESYPRVDALTFAPNGKPFEVEDNLTKLNLWRPNSVVPSPGDVKPFLAHAEFILPDARERKIFLQYLAFILQQPGKKVRWTIVLQGKQRTGKSYFGRALTMILGRHNVSRPTNERLHESWTDWQESAQLIVIEELMGYGRQDLMNKLKPMITEPTTMVRCVGGRAYEMPNRYNFLMFTNHKGALKIDQEDKRYCILFSPAERRPDEYYDQLWTWTEANLGPIANFLNEYSLEDFLPNGDAPATEARQQAIEMNRSDLSDWIEEGIKNMEGPFACALVIIEHLLLLIPEHISKRERVTRNSLSDALERAGARQVGRAQLHRLGYKRVWAVRNIEHWLKQSEGKRAKAYLDFVRVASGRAVADVDLTPEEIKLIGQGQKEMESMIKDTRPM